MECTVGVRLVGPLLPCCLFARHSKVDDLGQDGAYFFLRKESSDTTSAPFAASSEAVFSPFGLPG